MAKEFGQPDVDTFIDSLTPEQIDEWRALALIDGWHDGNEKLARMISTIHNAANQVSIAMGAKGDFKYWSFVDVLEMMAGKQPKSDSMTPEQFEQTAKARFG